MKLLVCGSRTWSDRRVIARDLMEFPEDTIVMHGNAPGADRIAAQIAVAIGLQVVSFAADWIKYGKAAGPIRNRWMLDQHPDRVLAYWNGTSPGTKDMIQEARKRGIRVEVCTPL